jgi:hypothetical protein
VSRQGPDSSSAARSSTAARSSNGRSRQAGPAASAAATASATSASVASAELPSRAECRCGWTTSYRSPPAIRSTPPIVAVSSTRSPDSSLTLASSEARSALPGA